ncbi:MAG TPA: SCO family protein, partial [Gammaproteobacteria bacterium]|nr:SCO family protein [Gammaproteobacteria bacterium]
MQREPGIATYKLITFIVFVMAALVTSLFVYHSSHQEKEVVTDNGNTMLLPVGRDLKNVALISADSKDFTERDFRNHWTLLFFGFTHCSSVCPVTMEMISKAYPDLHQDIPNLQVVLVSLDPVRDDKATLKKYTQSFNPDFIGVSGKIEDVHKLQSQLGVYSAKDDNSGSNYQLNHTASIMLVNPEGKWVGMFKFGMNEKEFSAAVKSGVNSLNR